MTDFCLLVLVASHSFMHECSIAGETFVSTCPDDYRVPMCMYWDEAARSWSTEGCALHWASTQRMVCNCTHLTGFAGSFRARSERVADVVGHIDDVTVEDVKENLGVVIGFGVLLLVFASCMCYGCYADYHDAKMLATGVMSASGGSLKVRAWHTGVLSSPSHSQATVCVCWHFCRALESPRHRRSCVAWCSTP